MLLFGFVLATKWGQQKRIFAIIFCYLPGVAACLILYLSPIKQSTKSAHLFAITIIAMVATSAGIMYSLLASNMYVHTYFPPPTNVHERTPPPVLPTKR